MALTVTKAAHGVCPCTTSGLAARLLSLPAKASVIGSGGFANLTGARALTQQASPPTRGGVGFSSTPVVHNQAAVREHRKTLRRGLAQSCDPSRRTKSQSSGSGP